MRNLERALLLAFSMLGLTSHAARKEIVERATRWRLDAVMGDIVRVFYTSSAYESCWSGILQLPANATAGDRNRFWGAVMTAKTADRKMLVIYETSNCTISSFGLAEE